MMFDFHTHHDRCGHAVDGVREYVEAAVAAGLTMIGISDHAPYFAIAEDHPHKRTAMAKSEFPIYVNEVLQLKEEFKGKIEVLLGIESDFFPEHIDLYRQSYAPYPMDYIIGSVHHSNGSNIFKKGRYDDLTEEEALKEKEIYLDLIRQSARSGLFDILGHIDGMKKIYPYYSEIKTNEIDHTMKVIAECDVTVEVNTSGRNDEGRDWYPDANILERAAYYGVKITCGSDAHKPERIAKDWDLVRVRLKELGYKEWAVFRKRQRIMIPL